MIYEPQFRHFIKWGKICITFGTFYDQLWASTSKGHKIFQLFWLQLVRMKSSKKKTVAQLLITFLLFEILANITFFLPLKSFITQEPHIFWQIAGTVLLSGYFLKCTPLLKELRKRFFELEHEHCTLTENPLRRLMLFHWYCNFNPPAWLNDVWYLWSACYFS